MNGDHTLVRLRPTAQLIPRGADMIQCGVNAATDGVFPIAPALQTRVCEIFNTLSDSSTVSSIHQQLVTAGMPIATAQLLLDDLRYHGVLIPAQRLSVVLLGRGVVVNLLAQALRCAGHQVQRCSTLHQFSALFDTLDAQTVLIPVGRINYSPHALQQCYQHPCVIPVSRFQTSAIVGPVRWEHQGSCLQCSHLHHTDEDPYWRQAAYALADDYSPNPVLDYAIASTLLRFFSTAELGPALIGRTIEFSPFYGYEHEQIVQQHSLCYFCWSNQNVT
ncbi:hypothetical protein [Corynebacterium sp. HS2168-gen11]|uniref:hypothetical protein n=1 Tax=Corynebacterium sp. HS2168-gen11 TaxID=2974027 RepID=UPI00216B1D10|nr:hypothetical protein [Corynebacterium sp. HS2168-gen11]MCS4535819.1 hypothetical protein [Corynebacterium sp. HS2168-gen11]